MPSRLGESAALGVGLGYLGTVVNYMLAAAYVVVLTRFIPLEDYGVYNSLAALLGLFWLFLPNFGIYIAVMREGAAVFARGGDVAPYFAAFLFLQSMFTVAYVVIVLAASPFYLRQFPEKFWPMVALIAAYTVLQGLANALSAYLWMIGRYTTQSVGVVLYNLVFRSLEVGLIVALRDVYAIPISMLVGIVANVAVYLRAVRRVPNPLLGVPLLKSSFWRFLGLGVQEWAIDYGASIAGNASTYLIFHFLGPSAAGIYGLAAYMLGFVTSFSGSVYSVYIARASRSLRSVLPISLDYARTAQAVSSFLSVSTALATPLLPILGIVHGQYVGAVPYAMALFGSAALGSAVAVFRGHFWVSGRGWRSAAAIMSGQAAGLAALALSAPRIGLFSAVIANYVAALVPLAFFLKWDSSLRRGVLPAFAASAALSSFLYFLWPLAQLAALAAVALLLYFYKPLPRPVLEQVPEPLRSLIRPFVQSI
ncbi:MAG: oligosaccharide flippase family protein [Thermoproteus sp.]